MPRGRVESKWDLYVSVAAVVHGSNVPGTVFREVVRLQLLLLSLLSTAGVIRIITTSAWSMVIICQ